MKLVGESVRTSRAAFTKSTEFAKVFKPKAEFVPTRTVPLLTVNGPR